MSRLKWYEIDLENGVNLRLGQPVLTCLKEFCHSFFLTLKGCSWRFGDRKWRRGVVLVLVSVCTNIGYIENHNPLYAWCIVMVSIGKSKGRLQVLDLSFLIFYARWPPLSTSWHWSTQLQANRIRSVAVHPGAWEVRAGRGSNRWAQLVEVRHSRILLKILSSSAQGFVVQIWLSRVWRGSKAEPKLIKKCFEASLPGNSTGECFHQLPWLSFKSALRVVKVWFQFTALQCTYMSKSMVLLRTSSINFPNELTSWSTQTMDLLPRWPWRMHGWLSKILVRMQMICRNSSKMTYIGTNLSVSAQSRKHLKTRLTDWIAFPSLLVCPQQNCLKIRGGRPSVFGTNAMLTGAIWCTRGQTWQTYIVWLPSTWDATQLINSSTGGTRKTRAKVGWRALGNAQVTPHQSGTMSRMKTQLSSRNTCPSLTASGIVTLPASSKLKDNVANAWQHQGVAEVSSELRSKDNHDLLPEVSLFSFKWPAPPCASGWVKALKSILLGEGFTKSSLCATAM